MELHRAKTWQTGTTWQPKQTKMGSGRKGALDEGNLINQRDAHTHTYKFNTNTCRARNTRTGIDPFRNMENKHDEKCNRGARMDKEPRAKSL